MEHLSNDHEDCLSQHKNHTQQFFSNHRIHFLIFITVTDLIYISVLLSYRLVSLKFYIQLRNDSWQMKYHFTCLIKSIYIWNRFALSFHLGCTNVCRTMGFIRQCFSWLKVILLKFYTIYFPNSQFRIKWCRELI